MSDSSNNTSRIDNRIDHNCRRIPNTLYRFHGHVEDYLTSVTQQWVLPAPYANPGMLEMFRDRDRVPLRCMRAWAGEFAGKYLTHAVQIYRLTKETELYEHLKGFVEELCSLQADDGYLGPWPKEYRLTGRAPNLNYPSYKPGTQWAFEKWGYYMVEPNQESARTLDQTRVWDTWGHYHIMLGLLLWHETTNDKNALKCASNIADLMCSKFLAGEESKRMVDTGSVEMNLAPVHSLAMLYSVVGNKRYLDLAIKIVEEFSATDLENSDDEVAGDYLNVGLRNEPFYSSPKPRWESLHPIMGLAELYWITGNRDYRCAFENLWWSMLETDRHNNGGFTSEEGAQGNPYHQGAIETCCTIAWMAMSVEMLKLTSDSRVADEIELSMLNSGLGLISKSGRWVTYSTPMDGVRLAAHHHIVGHSREGTPELNCCSVNGPRGIGMISDWAIMQSSDGGVLLNYYGPSEFTVVLGEDVRTIFSQETNYPMDGKVLLKVSPSEAIEFSLRLRIPYWSSRTKVTINGTNVEGVQSGEYLVINRCWDDGDVVQIDLDMSLHYWMGELECVGKVSAYRGPVLLTYDRRFNEMNPDNVPVLDASNLTGHLVSTDDYTIKPDILLEFTGKDGRKIHLCDFASAGEAGSPYMSWLYINNVVGTEFSRSNPLRSSRL